MGPGGAGERLGCAAHQHWFITAELSGELAGPPGRLTRVQSRFSEGGELASVAKGGNGQATAIWRDDLAGRWPGPGPSPSIQRSTWRLRLGLFHGEIHAYTPIPPLLTRSIESDHEYREYQHVLLCYKPNQNPEKTADQAELLNTASCKR